MAGRKKKTLELPPPEEKPTKLAKTPFGAGISSLGGIREVIPTEFSYILENPNLTAAQKRRAILRAQGIIKTRKKYESPTARKEAAKVRAKATREERKKLLAEAGIIPSSTPRKSYKGLSEEEKYKAKRQVSSTRGEKKRDWGKILAQALPRTAETFGISPKGRKTYGVDIQTLRDMILQELTELQGEGKL